MADFSFLRDQLSGKPPEISEIQDPSKYTRAQIVHAYLRYIISLAAKYSRPNVDQEDLVNEGLIGVLDAVDRFDPKKANGNPKAFKNLAIVRAKSFMHEYFLRNHRHYRFPGYIARAANLVSQVRHLIESTNFEGDVEDLIVNLDPAKLDDKFPVDVVKKIARAKERLDSVAESLKQDYPQLAARVLEIERSIENYETSQEGIDYSTEEFIGNKDFMDKVFSNLGPVARRILAGRLQGEKLETIGEAMGITRERVRQIEAETIEYIRKTRIGQEVSRA